ncbi:LPS export ABC transporter periplasmic protein LptC [Chlorogloea sp. CCALA 695]|uniref:LPS export ABC transporter periplasmic protein LptC n=1 Tax=Chlorogloea sp. CCALA 695 TaxID=2107693 RepID=UPI0018EB3905|nr:LPS export ABC transporter periplasmic protein LptC [Chlorogloea sp. CCALA 695]
MNFNYYPSFKWLLAAPLISVGLLFGCNGQSTKEVSINTSPTPATQNELTFNDVTLEQADEKGQPVWKVQGKQASYSREKKLAQVQKPSGELFVDGKVVYKISAQLAQIEQNGKQLFLTGQIVATDTVNGVVLHGNELEWRPKEDLLIVRKQVRGNYQQIQAVAQEARVNSRSARVDLQGKVVAIATDPALQMRTTHLIWEVKKKTLIGDRPIEIDRYKGKVKRDRATANGANVNLQTKVITLQPKAQIVATEPPVQINGNSLTWDLNAEVVTANQPIKIVHRQQQVTTTADRGRMNLGNKIAHLTCNVSAIGQRQQSLNAQKLTWYLPTQLVEAEGSVVYRQVEPPVSFTGQKAVGKLQEQNITVSGGRVVTKFIP